VNSAVASSMLLSAVLRPPVRVEGSLVLGSLALSGAVYVGKKVGVLTLIQGGKSAAIAKNTAFLTTLNHQRLMEAVLAVVAVAPGWLKDEIERGFSSSSGEFEITDEVADFFIMGLEPVLLDIAREHGITVEDLADFRDFSHLEEGRHGFQLFNSPSGNEIVLNSSENALNAVFFNGGRLELIRPGGGGNSTVRVDAEVLSDGSGRVFYVRTTPLVTQALGLEARSMRFRSGDLVRTVDNIVVDVLGDSGTGYLQMMELFGFSYQQSVYENLQSVERLLPLFFVVNRPGLVEFLAGESFDLRGNFEDAREDLGRVPVDAEEWLRGITVDGRPIYRDSSGQWVTDGRPLSPTDNISVNVPRVGVEDDRWVRGENVSFETSPRPESPTLPAPDSGILGAIHGIREFFTLDMGLVTASVNANVQRVARQSGLPEMELQWSDTGGRFQDIWVDFTLFGERVRFLLVHANQVNAFVDYFRLAVVGVLALVAGLKLVRRSPTLVSGEE